MNVFVNLAKNTIKEYLNNNQTLSAQTADESLLKKQAACFVSIHSKDNDQLRGCIGTIVPTCKNLAQEIINNAISACNDSRFEPISKKELANLDISVDVLSKPEPVSSEKLLNPKKYGVIVKAKDGRTGLLLPDLEEIDDASYQVAIARQKAGILPNEEVYLYRFTVQRHESHPNNHKSNNNLSE